MSQTAPSTRTVFRATVVNAVRGGEALMQQLVKATQSALIEEETQVRNIQQRNLVSDGLRLLNQHEAALVKGYPMALLEIFAEGPTTFKGRAAEDTGMDFGELSLMDESEVQAQVELAKAQQSALHATDAVLAELNTLVSAAQGLRSVQPERNPLRPESYIRALQQVVGETGVSPEVRQLWMQHMRDLLGKLLVEEYRRTAASLREHGVQPVGYVVLGAPGGGGRNNSSMAAPGHDGGYAGPGTGYGHSSHSSYSGYGHSVNHGITDYASGGYGRSSMGAAGGWNGDSQQAGMDAAAEEALLTVGILRQMLAGGDPFDARSYAPAPQGGVAIPPLHTAPARALGHAGATSPGPTSGHASAFPYSPAHAAAEAMEDIAQLERLVGRLAGGAAAGGLPAGSMPVPLSGWRLPPGVAPVVYATMPMEGAAQSAAVAAEVVDRMMSNIAQDRRLLPPVQKAVQSLQPALRQLVQHDGRFFSDAGHPARRLLDDLTQRSLLFTTETAPGFSSFMRLVNEAVGHLAAVDITDEGPFDTVLKALHAAWEKQEQKLKAHEEARQKAALHAEQRELLAEKIAADIRRLPDVDHVPADILDFAAGPWADVIALAQVVREPDSSDEDPGGYLELVPVLLWSSQPELTRQDPERLNETIPGLLAKLRKGLKTIGHPPAQTSALLQRLVALHQAAFEVPAASPVQGDPQSGASGEALDAYRSAPASEESVASELSPAAGAAPGDAAEPAPADAHADFAIGVWVELVTGGRLVRTQLTWCSPHRTLFLFTAPDASTQSMTRRMRDKLLADGSLRVVPAPVARAAQRGGDGAGPENSRLDGPLSTSSPADARLRGGPVSRSAPLSRSGALAAVSSLGKLGGKKR